MCAGNKNTHSRIFRALWITFSATICAASVAVLQSEGWNHEWASSAQLWFFLCAIGPALVAFALNAVSRLRGLVADLSDEPIGIRVHFAQLAICGVAFLGVALATTFSVDAFPFLGWARVVAFVIACTFFLSYGALAYIYVATLVLATRLGKVRVRWNIFSWPQESVGAIHIIYFRLLLLGTAVYLLGVAVVRLTPWARSWRDLNQPWVLAWVFPPGLTAITYFGIFSVALHKLLLQCRARAEHELNEHLQRIYDAWKTNHEPGAENSISALLKWRESVRLERLWPMDLKAAIVTVVTLLIPSIEAIAKLVR